MNTRRQMIQHAMLALTAAPFSQACAREQHSIKQPANGYDKALSASIPEGASLKIVARSGHVAAGQYPWHSAPDGGACFSTDDGGWVYVSNSEMPARTGGAGSLRFNAKGDVVDSYPILTGTSRNCAGGKTPWGTWLSCEENNDSGEVYECDPLGKKPAKALPLLGRYNHEAAAFDPATGYVYLTEDKPDGGLYRFIPENKQSLEKGRLEVAVIENGQLMWRTIPDPLASKIPTRYQVKNTAQFRGGEGIIYHNGSIFFTTKIDNRVWSLGLQTHQLNIVYDAATSKTPILTGVDNIEVTPSGELLVAEDGGNMQIIALTQNGEAQALVTLHNQNQSEITGPAFSPDGSRLYFSSQRGISGRSEDGITYELTLPKPFMIMS